MSKEFAKALVEVEVSQDDDVIRVMAVLRELGVALAAEQEAVLEPTEVVGIVSMNPHSCLVRTLTKTAPGQQWAVAREYRKLIILRFRQEGFSRPMPQRLVWNRPWKTPEAGA
jgi:small conductance mechanosensitive channel